MGSYLNFLKKIHFFSSLSDDDIKRIEDVCHEEEYEADRIVIVEGALGDKFFIILEGVVDIWKDPDKEPLAVYRQGQAFGTIALIDDLPRSASVITREPTRLLSIDKHNFKRIIAESSSISFAIMKSICATVRESNENYTDNVRERNRNLYKTCDLLNHEIEERKCAELELKKYKNRLEFLLAQSPAIIYSADPGCEFETTFISQNLEAIHGLSPADYYRYPHFMMNIGQPEHIDEAVEWIEDINEAIRYIKNMLSEKGHFEVEYCLRNQGGSYSWIQDRGRLVYDDVGNALELVGCMLDITDTKQMETKLREKQAQLVHAGRLSALGEMAAGIAHELNQPLHIIRLAIDGLKEDIDQNASFSYEYVKDIVEQIERASDIIKNMLSLARYDSNMHKPADLAETVNIVLSLLRKQFQADKIHLAESLSKDLPEVVTDSQKFQQMVMNLLLNARYAVDKKAENDVIEYKKEVKIRLFHETDIRALILEVEDNGIGMSAEVMNRCMEPFFTTKEVGEGSGLGLSVTYGIARELKMKIELESIEGQGSTFRILKNI